MMILHGYWRSSASYRVRIALGLKGVDVQHNPVNLREGEQGADTHRERNPQGFVPVLELEDGTMLTQSMAIIDYLDESIPNPPLRPANPVLRSKVIAASLVIAADTAPIQNLKVLKYIRAEHGQDDAGVKDWAVHWISEGFKSLEMIAQKSDTDYLLTGEPGLVECCLIPQVYNARRFGVDMEAYPKLAAIDAKCQKLPAFVQALPENQQDAPQ